MNRPFYLSPLNTLCVALGRVSCELHDKASKGTCRAKRGGKPFCALDKSAWRKSRPSVACTAVRTFAEASERRAASGSENMLSAKRIPSYRNKIEGPGNFPVYLQLDINRTTNRCLSLRKLRCLAMRSMQDFGCCCELC